MLICFCLCCFFFVLLYLHVCYFCIVISLYCFCVVRAEHQAVKVIEPKQIKVLANSLMLINSWKTPYLLNIWEHWFSTDSSYFHNFPLDLFLSGSLLILYSRVYKLPDDLFQRLKGIFVQTSTPGQAILLTQSYRNSSKPENTK